MGKKDVIRERALETLNRPDHAVMRRCNDWMAPAWVRTWMLAATKLGDGYLMILVSLLVLLSDASARYRATSSALVATFVSVAVFHQVKKLVGRRRPIHIHPHCWADLLPPDQFSFPSGHTMTSFAFAFGLEPFFPGSVVPLSILAANVGLSRIMLGMHFLTDVLAGAALGILIGRYVGTLFVL